MSAGKYYYLLAVYSSDWENYWEEGHAFSAEIDAGLEKWGALAGNGSDGKDIDIFSFPMEAAKKHPQLKVKTDPTLIFYIQHTGNEFIPDQKLSPVAKLIGPQINRRNIEFMMKNVLELEYKPGSGGFYNPAHWQDSLVGYGQNEDAPGGSLFGVMAINPLAYEIFIDKPNLLERILSFLFGSKIKGPGSSGGSSFFIIVLVILIIVGIWYWVKKKGGTNINIFTSKGATV